MILQDPVNPERILYFENVMDTDILRSVAEGRFSIINYLYIYIYIFFFFRRTRETAFSSNKRVTVGRELAATHVAVVSLSLRCDDNQCGVRRCHWISFSE